MTGIVVKSENSSSVSILKL